MEKFYVSTSAVYTNAQPHIGFAHESIVADVLARYHRLTGKKVFFLTGTDEHGLKIYRAAKKAKKKPKELCDHITKFVKELKPRLSLTYDYFSRTTDSRHIKATQKLWLAIQENGDLEKRKYAGWYCPGCEAFKTEKELVNGKCPNHLNMTIEWIEDENYFFKLSKYTPFLKKYLQSHKDFILPKHRHNEILSFLKRGLEDISVSRSKKLLSWGIPVPNDPKQVMYCWFDALIFYISSIGYADDSKTFKKWWGDNSFKLHIVGKDINRFHSCLWTSMLQSAGLFLPNQIFVHGFITSGGERMSKSSGNVIDPVEMVKRYGTDPLRYFLLAEGFYGDDIDFTEERFRARYNADLANGLGNVVARIAKLCENSKLKFKTTRPSKEIYSKKQQEAFEDFRFDIVLRNIWTVYLHVIDKHIDQHKPWLIKDKNELQRVLQEEIDELREFSTKLKPFLPETAEKIEKQFKGPKIKAKKPLFPRI